MKIQVLHAPGCASYPRAIGAVNDAVHMAGVDADVEAIEVLTLEQARELRVLGSPSVHVDGTDVEPDARSRTDYNLG